MTKIKVEIDIGNDPFTINYIEDIVHGLAKIREGLWSAPNKNFVISINGEQIEV